MRTGQHTKATRIKIFHINVLARWMAFLVLLFSMLPLNQVSASEDTGGNEPRVTVVWFHMSPCASCDGEAFINEQLSSLSENPDEPTSWELTSINTFHASGREKMAQFIEAYAVPPEKSLEPLVFLNGLWLQGFPEIEANFGRTYLQASDNLLHPPGLPPFMKTKQEARDEWILRPAEDTPGLILYFSAPTCSACEKASAHLSVLSDTHGSSDASTAEASLFTLQTYSLADPDTLPLINWYFDSYNVPESAQQVPIVFYGDNWLSGDKDILLRLEDDLTAGKAVGTRLAPELASTPRVEDSAAIRNSQSEQTGQTEIGLTEAGQAEQNGQTDQNGQTGTEARTLLGMFGTGLLNGLNPCSLSMMLFFLALLATRPKGMLVPAFWFILGKFTGFLLLGFGLVEVLTGVPEAVMSFFLRIVLPLGALAMALLNLHDYRAARKEAYQSIRLQLPEKLRRFNHQWIKRVGGLLESDWLYPASFGMGLIIAGGDFLCTGQIYLATLLAAMRMGNPVSTAGFLLYGFAFILPLFLLAGLIHMGKAIFDISEWVRSHMAAVKLANALFFLGFGLWMLLGQ